jgi:hypothetical protein
MMLMYDICEAKSATLVKGFPLEPVHGRCATAADMILEEPGTKSNTTIDQRVGVLPTEGAA